MKTRKVYRKKRGGGMFDWFTGKKPTYNQEYQQGVNSNGYGSIPNENPGMYNDNYSQGNSQIIPEGENMYNNKNFGIEPENVSNFGTEPEEQEDYQDEMRNPASSRYNSNYENFERGQYEEYNPTGMNRSNPSNQSNFVNERYEENTQIAFVASHPNRLLCLFSNLFGNFPHQLQESAILYLKVNNDNQDRNQLNLTLSQIYSGSIGKTDRSLLLYSTRRERQRGMNTYSNKQMAFEPSFASINKYEYGFNELNNPVHIFFIVSSLSGTNKSSFFSFGSSTDPPLSQQGIQQAIEAGDFLVEYLNRLQLINQSFQYFGLASDLKRSQETLGYILKRFIKEYNLTVPLYILPCAHEISVRNGQCDKSSMFYSSYKTTMNNRNLPQGYNMTRYNPYQRYGKSTKKCINTNMLKEIFAAILENSKNMRYGNELNDFDFNTQGEIVPQNLYSENQDHIEMGGKRRRTYKQKKMKGGKTKRRRKKN